MREPRAWREGWVHTEFVGPYTAEISQIFRWRGHACPRFTRATAEQIAKDATAPITGAGRRLPPDYTSWHWDGDVLILEKNRELVDYGPDPEAYLERYEPDQDGMYRAGDWEWEATYTQTPPKRHTAVDRDPFKSDLGSTPHGQPPNRPSGPAM